VSKLPCTAVGRSRQQTLSSFALILSTVLLNCDLQATCSDMDLNNGGLQPWLCPEGTVSNPANSNFSPPSNSRCATPGCCVCRLPNLRAGLAHKTHVCLYMSTLYTFSPIRAYMCKIALSALSDVHCCSGSVLSLLCAAWFQRPQVLPADLHRQERGVSWQAAVGLPRWHCDQHIQCTEDPAFQHRLLPGKQDQAGCLLLALSEH
jgi:hypothetical protein